MFHLSTIKEETYAVLKQIFSISEVYENFALAGGTALALQLGHRDSIDLDVFSTSQFDTRNLEIVMLSTPAINFEFVRSNSRMLFGFANKVKCDFVHEPAPLIRPFIENDGVKYFHAEDIAAMKMHTICGRGKRKDFFDIYALMEVFGWQQMLEWFEKKYGANQFYILWRSVQYFNDADEDAEISGFPPFSKS